MRAGKPDLNRWRTAFPKRALPRIFEFKHTQHDSTPIFRRVLSKRNSLVPSRCRARPDLASAPPSTTCNIVRPSFSSLSETQPGDVKNGHAQHALHSSQGPYALQRPDDRAPPDLYNSSKALLQSTFKYAFSNLPFGLVRLLGTILPGRWSLGLKYHTSPPTRSTEAGYLLDAVRRILRSDVSPIKGRGRARSAEGSIINSTDNMLRILPLALQRALSDTVFDSHLSDSAASSLVHSGVCSPHIHVKSLSTTFGNKAGRRQKVKVNAHFHGGDEFAQRQTTAPMPDSGSPLSIQTPAIALRKGGMQQRNYSSHKGEGSEENRDSSSGVFIALGSNIGDRFEAIESACRAINEDPDMRIVRVSYLYETEPMYVRDQGRFLNGVCEIETLLPPLTLLDRLQAIENNLGRVKSIDKGPRNIDLDILLYRTETVDTERLKIPHLLMWERAFVLRPLRDLLSPGDRLFARVEKALRSLPIVSMEPSSYLASPLQPLRPREQSRPRHMMAILNTTPDSFSDGGDNKSADIETLRDTIAAHIAAGASIIDIGGQSSRPNAEDITATEEIARVLPAIEAAKSLAENNQVVISVDTYRAEVAEAAVQAGAHVVNDISAGLLDPAMLPTVARLGCSYVMMHMRGTPATMQSAANTTYSRGVLMGVRDELLERVEAARMAGIHPWRIILDPGFGFAKTLEQNLQLLKEFRLLRNDNHLGKFPWLIGTSRKGFVGKVTGVEAPKDRIVGTAVTVAATAFQGADIFRVHDVRQMTEAIAMGVAIGNPETRRKE